MLAMKNVELVKQRSSMM